MGRSLALPRSLVLPLLATTFLYVSFAGIARADTLLNQTNLVGLPTVAAPSEFAFTATAAEALTVTLTDFQAPAAFSSLQIAVTLGNTLVGVGTVSGTTATVAVPAAAGSYVLRVVGTPDATQGIGSFGVCVTRNSDPTPRSCIAGDSFSGNLQTPSAASTTGTSLLDTNFTTTIAGTYTVTLTDDAFPVALSAAAPASAAIFSGGNPVIVGIPAGVPTTVSLGVGTYDLKAIAVADPSVLAGLYGIRITNPAGAAVFDRTIPVGALGSPTIVDNASTQKLTLSVSDYRYPAPLTRVGAAVTSGGAAPLAKLTAPGNVANDLAPAGTLEVWKFAVAGAEPGVYGVNLASGTASLLSATQVANPGNASSTGDFAFLVTLPAAGTYQLSVGDFQFPSSLLALKGTIAQNGKVLTQNSSGDFSAAAGVAVVVVDAQAPQSGNGIFAVTVQSTGAPATVLLDTTQAVGGVFDTRVITVGTSGRYDVTLTDLGFPADFQNLAVVVSQAGQVLGKIYGGGTFPISLVPGQYILTFVATPNSQPTTPPSTLNYGLYSINIASSAPTVTLTAGAASVTAGQPVQLTWSSQYATACTASGSTAWTGSEALSGTAAVTITESVTLTLTCTGPGGSAAKSVNVAASQDHSSGSSGGGSIDPVWIGALMGLAALRLRRLVTRGRQ